MIMTLLRLVDGRNLDTNGESERTYLHFNKISMATLSQLGEFVSLRVKQDWLLRRDD